MDVAKIPWMQNLWCHYRAQEGPWPGPPYQQGMILDLIFPDTLSEIWLPSLPNWPKLETFDVTRRGEAIWQDWLGLKWPMCPDRYPEIC